MSNSNRFNSTKKNQGTMTFKISDDDWKAVKILTSFYECSPGDLISALIKKEIKGYPYHSEAKEVDNSGEK